MYNFLFIHNGNETFVQIDHNILKNIANVEDFQPQRKFPNHFIHYFKGIRHCDAVFCWFASWNSFWALLFAKLQKKPSLLVIGGYDIANLPEIGYGHQRGGLKKWVSRWSIHLASTLITNSYYSQEEAEKNIGIPKDQVHVVYHGVPDPFGELPEHKEDLVLTVGNVDQANLKRKGHEPFVRAAALMPNTQFVLVGAWKDNSIDYLRSITTSNVLFTGRISDEELLDYYRRASVYVQLSQHEGFGMSVAEAMLAGCIPVVSRAGSLPEVVGDAGIYVENLQLESIKNAFQTALTASFAQRELVRQRILTLFTLEKRQQVFEELIIKSVEK